MSRRRIAVIGAGFSGLTIAWELSKKNFEVEIFEASERTGGLIGTTNDGILVEQAANAMLANQNIESLFKELGVKAVSAGYRSNKRWIFRSKPLTMPISLMGLIVGMLTLLFSFLSGKIKPRPQESLAAWAQRVLNKEFCTYLISPAFQGVYSTSADRLSASLVLGSLFRKDLKSPKGELRGSISANGGMQDIINGLTAHLKNKGVIIHTNTSVSLSDLESKFDSTVVATSIGAAGRLLKEKAPVTSSKISQIPLLPLASVTLKFNSTKRVQGFGCLFPKPENFSALGVLFPSDIFPYRGDNTETWITSDALSADSDLLEALLQDHQRLTGEKENAERYYIKRWPQALPLYGAELEKLLAEADFAEGLISGVRISECKSAPLYLTGNYLGVIGLAKIFDYNLRLSGRIEKELA